MNTSKASFHRLIASASVAALLSVGIGGIVGCQQEIISSAPKARAAGIKQFDEGQYADAAGSFRNALRSDPRDYKSQFYLAQSYENLKQYQQAIQAYKASLDVQPRTLAGKEDKAQRIATIEALAACISKSDNRDAETDLIDQQAKAPNRAQDWLLLAKIYQHRGDADSALDAYNRGALSDPSDFVLVKEFGLYLEQAGQKPRATQQLKRAYTLNPNDEEVNNALRRLNIVPGPGLKDQSALVKPPIPQGPLPEVDLSKFKFGGSGGSSSSSSSASTAEEPAAAAPAAPPVAPAAPAASFTPPPSPTAEPGNLPAVPRATNGPRD